MQQAIAKKSPRKLHIYISEDEKLKEDTWGYDIPPSTIRHCWTKLLLDGNGRITQFTEVEPNVVTAGDELAASRKQDCKIS